MKKKSIVFICVVAFIITIFIAFFLYSSNASKYNIVNEDVKKIRIGISPNKKPYSYLNENNVPIGYNIDVMNAIALEMGIDIEWVDIEEREVLVSIFVNKVDCVLGIDYDHVLPEYIIKAKPFINNRLSIFIPKYNNNINSIEDLKFKKVSAYIDDPYLDIVNNIEGIRLFTSDNIETAFSLMIFDITEAYVGDKNIGTDYVNSSNYQNKLKTIGEVNCEWMSSFVTISTSSDLVEIVNQGLESIERKGTLDTIKAKWFGKSIEQNPRWLIQLLVLTAIFLLLSSFAVIIFYRINKLLKKQVEERTFSINEEKNLKESIIDSLFEGLIFVDIEGNIASANPSARYILDEQNSLIGKNLFDTNGARFFEKNLFEEIINNSEKSIKTETNKSKKHNDKYVEYSLTPVMSQENKLSGITLTFRDITEEKKMMRKLIDKDKLETIGRLTAGIAHEIRNPLTSIGMYVKLLPKKINSESFRNQILEDMPKEIKRLDSIIKSLLDYAKPVYSQKEVFNLNDEINFIIRLLINQLSENQIELVSNIDENVEILYDKQQFKQIIINILINSIKALENVHNPKIEIIGYKTNKIYIEIIDNGYGISKDVADNIFQPFFSTKSDGYGLGLSIVDQLVKENQSEIIFDTSYLNGAKFIIIIPF